MRTALFACSLIVAWSLSSVADAQSMGCWRLPSTPAQYFGYGVGPGHHAPMVRAPCYQPPRVQRITVVPAQCDPFCRDTGGFCGRHSGMPVESVYPMSPEEVRPDVAARRLTFPVSSARSADPPAWVMPAPPAWGRPRH